MDDNALMLAVIDGDLDKLGILFEKYKEPLLAYFIKVVKGDQQTAEDLVQNVFHRLLKYKNQYKGNSNFIGWLFSIARNCGIDHHRKKRFSYSYGAYENTLQQDDTAEESIERMERIDALYKAMDKLAPSDREVLILGKLDGLKYRDIALILNCSESAIRIKIFRAIKKLKDVYMKLEIAE